MAIKNWSSTPASNNSTPPNGAPEGTTKVSQVNDILRQIMADVRAWYESPTWIDLGDTPTYVSETTFTLSGDVTATYDVDRRLKLTDASTLYATITASSHSGGTTTVTVDVDSGTLTSSLSAVEVSIIGGSNQPVLTSLTDGSVTAAKLADEDFGDFTVASGVATIDDGVVTKAKIEDVADMKVLGNVSGASAAPAEVSILDEDDLTSDSDTAIPTQQSVKAYVDNSAVGNVSELIASDGYEEQSNGIIRQWGQVSMTSNGTTTFTFPKAFTTACYSIVAQMGSSTSSPGSGTNITGWEAYPVGTTQFTIENDGAAAVFYWQAVGL